MAASAISGHSFDFFAGARGEIPDLLNSVKRFAWGSSTVHR